MNKQDKINAIKRANLRLNESWGDNGDEENEKFMSIQNALIGDEGYYGPMTPKEIITTAIDLARKADITSGEIATVLDFILKSRY